ncbi:aminoglycoside phosphotransferase family protein [Streptomyces sp. NBC_01465]|uniref:aminoglycoside phosphotransferase family protein n=1 Tax=Streptomyces sp. NBC_01465 TaxID=2903878 RepID=UPI002E333BB4|nr:aminoglycoside phosphotransferase family protein [Streptomyces sp. NBC_01465]
MTFEPPQRLVNALGEAQDGQAEQWLKDLPRLLQEAALQRELTVERIQMPGGRSSLVALVRQADGTPATLKLAPGRGRPEPERAALTQWNGFGAVQLLGPDTGDGALLMERLRPEVSVRSLPESRALLEAAGTLRRLWIEPPPGRNCETVTERTGRQAAAMRASVAAFPEIAPLVDAAVGVRDELVMLPPETRLLHGTFRQSKVLSSERMPWLAIGPDPVVGETAFDLARLVRDRVEDLIAASTGASTTRRRVKKLAESLEVDQERLRGWTLFRAVESGVRALRVGRPKDAELLLEFADWL